MIHRLFFAIPFAALLLAVVSSPVIAEDINLPMGDVPTSFGLPANQATIEKLYDELDY
ncbi:hypothetical protein LJR231_004857 [Phyllobacterium sp. LjRoot231]|uniref:hypothetical protein n=1 Tax=Phyllobacterium sp. LjRoot231 TaxID=3342289 RepID=UPI003ED09B56